MSNLIERVDDSDFLNDIGYKFKKPKKPIIFVGDVLDEIIKRQR